MSVTPGENQTEAPATTRRRLIVGAGVVGAASLLVACGTESAMGSADNGGTAEDAPADTGDDAPADTGDGAPAGALAAEGDIPVGGGLILADRAIVITRPAEDQWHAFDTACTHQGCPVTSIEAGTITCKCHGSEFSATDGSVIAGPATAPLAARTIAVQDGWVIKA